MQSYNAMKKKNLLITLAVVATACAGVYIYWYSSQSDQSQQKPTDEVVRLEEKAILPPPPPAGPTFLEFVMKSNPQLDQATAEQYVAERIQANIAHQENRVIVLKAEKDVTPERLIEIEIELTSKLSKVFKGIDERYGIRPPQPHTRLLGAPTSAPQ